MTALITAAQAGRIRHLKITHLDGYMVEFEVHGTRCVDDEQRAGWWPASLTGADGRVQWYASTAAVLDDLDRHGLRAAYEARFSTRADGVRVLTY